MGCAFPMIAIVTVVAIEALYVAHEHGLLSLVALSSIATLAWLERKAQAQRSEKP